MPDTRWEGYEPYVRSSYSRRRSKIDWAGPGVGDAYNADLDYSYRLLAQRRLHAATKAAQIAVARLTGASSPDARLPQIKPQISPLFADYPSTPAAHAVIGQTAYLELEERTKTRVLQVYLADYLKDPATADEVDVVAEIYKHVANMVVRSVQARLNLEELSRCEFNELL